MKPHSRWRGEGRWMATCTYRGTTNWAWRFKPKGSGCTCRKAPLNVWHPTTELTATCGCFKHLRNSDSHRFSKWCPPMKRYSSTVKPVDSTLDSGVAIPCLSFSICNMGMIKKKNNLRQSSVIKIELIHAKILESLPLMISIINIQSLAYYSCMQDKLGPLPFLVRCCCQKFLLYTKPKLSSLKFPLIYPKPNRKDRAE